MAVLLAFSTIAVFCISKCTSGFCAQGRATHGLLHSCAISCDLHTTPGALQCTTWIETVAKAQSEGRSVSSTRKPKTLNLATYKFHSMDHYVPGIARVGTSDNYTTALQEASLREPNDDFLLVRTSKRDYEPQIVRNAVRKQVHFDMRSKLTRFGIDLKAKLVKKDKQRDNTAFKGDSDLRYHIAKRDGSHQSFRQLQSAHAYDPAFYEFRMKLQCHCLARLAGLQSTDATFPYTDYSSLEFHKDRIYPHSRISFNYTTYDIRRAQDPVGTNTRKRDVMLLAADTGRSEPSFAYARVIGIFHVKVRHHRLIQSHERLDVLHVRWFRRDVNFESGWAAQRLDRLEFIPSDDPKAFGFLDPALVIRGSHLVQAFAHGRTQSLLRSLGPSIAQERDGDWRYFYAARFADSDMMMRYTNLGIGHEGARPHDIDMTEPEPFPEIQQPTTWQEDEWDDASDVVDLEPHLETIPEEDE